MISLNTASDYPRERGAKKAMRNSTERPVDDTGDKYLVLNGPLGNTFAKTIVHHWSTLDTKSRSRKWHLGTGWWQRIRRGTCEMDFALPFVTAPRTSK